MPIDELDFSKFPTFHHTGGKGVYTIEADYPSREAYDAMMWARDHNYDELQVFKNGVLIKSIKFG